MTDMHSSSSMTWQAPKHGTWGILVWKETFDYAYIRSDFISSGDIYYSFKAGLAQKPPWSENPSKWRDQGNKTKAQMIQ